MLAVGPAGSKTEVEAVAPAIGAAAGIVVGAVVLRTVGAATGLVVVFAGCIVALAAAAAAVVTRSCVKAGGRVRGSEAELLDSDVGRCSRSSPRDLLEATKLLDLRFETCVRGHTERKAESSVVPNRGEGLGSVDVDGIADLEAVVEHTLDPGRTAEEKVELETAAQIGAVGSMRDLVVVLCKSLSFACLMTGTLLAVAVDTLTVTVACYKSPLTAHCQYSSSPCRPPYPVVAYWLCLDTCSSAEMLRTG